MENIIIRNALLQNPEITKEIGQTLYIKLTEVAQSELASITEKECIEYAYNLVLRRIDMMDTGQKLILFTDN